MTTQFIVILRARVLILHDGAASDASAGAATSPLKMSDGRLVKVRAHERKSCTPKLAYPIESLASRNGSKVAMALRMSKPIPTVQKYMTTQPHSVGVEQTMAKAKQMMQEHHIRHLPVLAGGRLVGIVSERDLSLLATLRDVDPMKVTVEEAMTTETYQVLPDAPIDEVVATMAERKYGSAVVVQNGHLVGIFTSVDACRAFAELLHGRLAK